MADLTRGTCVYCACTEAQACEGGCAWADATESICSSCAVAAAIAGELVAILGAIATNPKAGIRLATAKWDALPLAQQRVLVMTCRATIDGLRIALKDEMGLDADCAGVELSLITGFLLERCPDAIGPEDSASDVVIRLLEPHIGSRIVLPDGVAR